MGYLVGFGLVLMMFNLGLIQLCLTISRHKGRSTGALLSNWVSPMVMLSVYLAILTLPALASLFRRPRTF